MVHSDIVKKIKYESHHVKIMGASNDFSRFDLKIPNPKNQDSVKSATTQIWKNLVKDREYQHGHGGYTGTFAEKDDVVIAYFPTLSNDEIVVFSENVMFEEGEPPKALMNKARLDSESLLKMKEVFSSKYGPALGITNGSYVEFMGMCSS